MDDINLFVNHYIQYMEIFREFGREQARAWLAKQGQIVTRAVDTFVCTMNASAPAPLK